MAVYRQLQWLKTVSHSCYKGFYTYQIILTQRFLFLFIYLKRDLSYISVLKKKEKRSNNGFILHVVMADINYTK